MPMKLESWDATINQIAAEAIQNGGKDNVLIAWRGKLEEEPTSLHPFQIDEIMREVRKRMSAVSRRETGVLRQTG
jgi:hypothetical protein